MKYLVFILIFIAGGIGGYFAGRYQKVDVEPITTNSANLVTEVVYDTIVEERTIEIPVYKEIIDTISDVVLIDSSSLMLDTLSEKILQKDTLIEELDIRKDELILTKRITIQYLEEIVEKDTVIKELLGIKNSIQKELVVQFWSSPISYEGYKLSNNTLVLYGVPEQFNYEIYKRDNFYYLITNDLCYEIIQTQDFKPYKEVDRGIVFND